MFDWAAVATVAFSPAATTHGSGAPGPTASPRPRRSARKFTYYLGELDDQTSAGAVSYGIGGTGTGPFTIVAIEAKSAGGGTDATVTMDPRWPGHGGAGAAGGQPDQPRYAATAADLGGGAGSWAAPRTRRVGGRTRDLDGPLMAFPTVPSSGTTLQASTSSTRRRRSPAPT